MMMRFFLFLALIGSAFILACESHTSKKPDDDTLLPDEELSDQLPPDEETVTDGSVEEPVDYDAESIDDNGPAEDSDEIEDDQTDTLLPENDTSPDDDVVLTNPISVPYFCQYKNSQNPGTTSGNTSIAMLLYFYGWVGIPDDITGTWGGDKAQNPEGLAEIFDSYAGTTGATVITHTDGTFDAMKALIDEGKPVLLHTWFTAAGHVVVLNGYGPNGYFVNDPSGVWDLEYQGDFSLSCNDAVVGKSEYYPAAAFEAATGPDGAVRFHEPVTE